MEELQKNLNTSDDSGLVISSSKAFVFVQVVVYFCAFWKEVCPDKTQKSTLTCLQSQGQHWQGGDCCLLVAMSIRRYTLTAEEGKKSVYLDIK